MSDRIVIYTALQREADAILSRMPDAQVRVVGIGAQNLPPQPDGPADYILAGVAGALDPSLEVGDVVYDHDDPPWRIYTSPTPVITAAQKAELFHSTGAKAVDMEGAIVRQFVAGVATRFTHVRTISDTADECIDPAVLGLIDVTGRPRAGAILRTLVRRPALL